MTAVLAPLPATPATSATSALAPVAAIADRLPGRSARDGVTAHDLRWIYEFVRLYVEVEAGLRPARHLRRVLSLDLQQRLGGCGRPGPLPTVVRVHAQRRRGRCEAVVLLRRVDRVGALVIALQEMADGWRVVELCRPEGPPPEPPAPPAVDVLPPAWEDDEDDVDRSPGPRWTMPDGWRRAAA